MNKSWLVVGLGDMDKIKCIYFWSNTSISILRQYCRDDCWCFHKRFLIIISNVDIMTKWVNANNRTGIDDTCNNAILRYPKSKTIYGLISRYWCICILPSPSWRPFSSQTLQCTVDLTTLISFSSLRPNRQPIPSLGSDVKRRFSSLPVFTRNRCRAANVSERTDRSWLFVWVCWGQP